MRDPKRIPELCKLLEREWSKAPDLRLCQLISNVVSYSSISDGFYLEDDEFEWQLIKFMREHLR